MQSLIEKTYLAETNRDAQVRAPFDEIAARVEAAKEVKPAPGLSRSMICRCTGHDDNRPSLLVSETDDGRVLMHCRAGCSFDEVLQGLGLEPIDLIPTHLRHNRQEGHRPVSKGPRFSAWQTLGALSVDALIVVLCAARIRQDGWLDDDDLNALIEAEGRIQATIDAGGLRK